MMSTTKSRTETRGLSVRGPGPHPGLSPHCTEHTFRGGVQHFGTTVQVRVRACQ
jgi:hypothetical protein